jgi:hypothetical protein
LKPSSVLVPIVSGGLWSASAGARVAPVRGVPRPEGIGVSSSSGAVADARSSAEPVGAPATAGCFAMRASSVAMSSGERMKSTEPAATALRGIES